MRTKLACVVAGISILLAVAQVLQERQAVEARHAQVRDQEVEVGRLELVARGVAGGHALDLVPARGERLHQDVAEPRVVVCDEDSRHSLAS